MPPFCADCFKGTLRGDAVPKGTVEKINGLPTYVARPSEGKEPAGIVVIAPDAFGWELLNNRALADVYAERIPALVLLPDFMGGRGLPAHILSTGDKILAPTVSWWYKAFVSVPRFILQGIIYAIPLFYSVREAVARPLIANYLKAVRTSPPAPLASAGSGLRLGIAGFCWGGKYAIAATHDIAGDRLPGTGAPLVDAAFAAHPSLVKVPADFEKVKLPLCVANGDNDIMIGRKMELCKKILDEKEGCEAVVFPGARHGFAVRGDPNDPKQAEIGLAAEDLAVRWFREKFE